MITALIIIAIVGGVAVILGGIWIAKKDLENFRK